MGIATAVLNRTGYFFGWWVVFACASIVFLTGGTFFYGFGALFNPIVNEFGWSRASVSFAFSLRSEVGGLAAPVVGFMVDRVGSRRLMIVGVALVSLGFILLSRVESLWAFYASVVVIAIGMSATGGPVGMVTIAHWFKRQRGRALAIMTVGAGASGVMVLVLSGLITAFGWRDALVIVAITQLVVCIPLALSIRNRPEDLGLEPDGDARPWVEGVETQPARPPATGLTAREALKTSAFWKASLATGLGNVGVIAIVVHQIPFFTDSVGVSKGVAAASVTAMTLMSLLGRLGFGWMADQMDKRWVMAGAFALSGVSLYVVRDNVRGVADGVRVAGVRDRLRRRHTGAACVPGGVLWAEGVRRDPGTRLHNRDARRAARPGVRWLGVRRDGELPAGVRAAGGRVAGRGAADADSTKA